MKKEYKDLESDVLLKMAKVLVWMPLAVLYLLFLSPSTSPLFVTEGIDSAVFKTLGLALLKGKTLYVDIFDNKGPLLYLINAAGLGIGGNLGLFALQVLGFTLTLYYVYRTVRLFAKPLFSLLSVLSALFLYSIFIQEGNQCEEWILYLFAPGFYYACRTMVCDNGRLKGIWMGVMFGAIMFIRINDAVSLAGGLMFGWALYMLSKKQWKVVVRESLCFLVGAVIVSLPVVIWMASQHALNDMWQGMVGINMSYTGGFSMFSTMSNRVKLSLLLIFVAFVAMLWDIRNFKLIFLLVPVLSLFLLTMGFKFYFHYYIVLLPVLAMYVALLFVCCRPMMLVSLGVLLLSSQTYEMRPLPRMARKIITLKTFNALDPKRQQAERILYQEAEALFNHVPAAEKDSVWNYNVGADEQSYYRYPVLYHSGIVQLNRQIGDFCGVNTDAALFEGGWDPLWIVVDNEAPGAPDGDSVFMSRYTKVAVTDASVLNFALYRRR